MERYSQPRHNRESLDTGISPGLLKIFKGLASVSDRLFRQSGESLNLPEVERYSFESYVVTSHTYQEDTTVKVADILPEKDQAVVMLMADKLERQMGDQSLYYIALGQYSVDQPRLRIRRVHRWSAMTGGQRYETGPPQDLSLVRFFNTKGIDDDIELKAGSRVVRFEPSDATEFYLGDLQELPESDPARAAFEKAR